MKKITRIVFIFASLFFLTTCDLLKINDDKDTLSENQIVDGLKSALVAGSDTTTRVLNKPDSYYSDKAIKILLPPEAQIIIDNANNIPGLSNMIDNVIKCMNRAAEDAAITAKPIFVDAIKGLSIADGISILNGKNPAVKAGDFDSTAATGYLKVKTYTPLKDAFKPLINTSLDKKIILGISTNEAWTTLTSTYNDIAFIMGWRKVNTDLSDYVTTKALDGLFLKVGIEEKKIRKNPFKWAVDIIQKVFGSVFKSS